MRWSACETWDRPGARHAARCIGPTPFLARIGLSTFDEQLSAAAIGSLSAMPYSSHAADSNGTSEGVPATRAAIMESAIDAAAKTRKQRRSASRRRDTASTRLPSRQRKRRRGGRSHVPVACASRHRRSFLVYFTPSFRLLCTPCTRSSTWSVAWMYV